MDASTKVAVIGVFCALLAPLLTYIVAARRLSGRIKDSEATELWKESSSIREWSAARIKELDEHVDKLEARVNELEGSNSELAEENRALLREVYDCRVENTTLKSESKSEIDRLRALLAQAHQQLKDHKAGET